MHNSPGMATGTISSPHLHTVAAEAEIFAAVFGHGELTRPIGILHDCGKFSDSLQQYLLDCYAAQWHGGREPTPTKGYFARGALASTLRGLVADGYP
ncbi:MAG TPA: hypothetical protein VGK19_12190 [Capsulimonadaceae bacterium]